MKNTCPVCHASVIEREGRHGFYFKCSKCSWWDNWEHWVDECQQDPEQWNHERYIAEAEAEATNPNN